MCDDGTSERVILKHRLLYKYFVIGQWREQRVTYLAHMLLLIIYDILITWILLVQY